MGIALSWKSNNLGRKAPIIKCSASNTVWTGGGMCNLPTFGTLKFRKGDFIYIPRGTTYRAVMDERNGHRREINNHACARNNPRTAAWSCRK